MGVEQVPLNITPESAGSWLVLADQYGISWVLNFVLFAILLFFLMAMYTRKLRTEKEFLELKADHEQEKVMLRENANEVLSLNIELAKALYQQGNKTDAAIQILSNLKAQPEGGGNSVLESEAESGAGGADAPDTT